jgi:ketosteroid isomerase-like protein
MRNPTRITEGAVMNKPELFARAYAAFNNRDIEGVLALMTENVSWPKASEGGRVAGKQAIREYWTRQWADFDPHVDILEVEDQEDGRIGVKVRQLVKSLKGDVLSDTELWHIYSVESGLIERMDIKEFDGNTEGQSAAFSVEGH